MPSVDVLHVCYGGLGGHSGVVTALAAQMGAVGLSTGVVAIATASQLADRGQVWAGVSVLESLPISGRADVRSMIDGLAIARRMQARMVVMHTHRHATSFAWGRLASRQRLNMVTAEHMSLAARTRSGNVNSATSLLWSKSVVFLSAASRNGYPLRKLPFPALSRAVVIANGIDVDAFDPGATRAKPDTGAFRIGTAVRLTPTKDVATLLRALRLLQKEDPERCLELRIAGEGELRADLEVLTGELGLESRVTFLGQIPEGRMPEFLGSLDAYAQPTLGETLSMSLLQASAAGVPIVATDVPGVNDVFIDGKTALLTTPSSPASMAAAIDRLRRTPELRRALAVASRELVAARHTSRRMAIGYLRLFAELDPGYRWLIAAQQLDGDLC